MHAARVRVVGTNTLRKARRTEKFLRQARRALGQPVEVISGIEEARLIYLGASHSLPKVRGTQLVVDIGGGSTEVIQGRGRQPEDMESLYIGCVGLTAAAFADGKLNERNFRAARQLARLEFEPIKTRFTRRRPVRVAGASGTIRAAHDVLNALGRSRKGVSADDLEFLIAEMIACRAVRKLRLPGLPDDRAVVFPGGVAILAEAVRALRVQRMVVADGALREGILYDMVGRLIDEDARLRTVRAMQARFRVDARQADRVAATAQGLLRQVAGDWEVAGEAERHLLNWAARLHELGLDIAHAHYHFHGAYLLENADMPGFARDEQRVLACVVRAHRRRLDREMFAALPREWRVRALRLAVILRLAVLLHRSRTRQALPALKLTANGRSLRLSLPAGWLRANPLTHADLDRECEYLAAARFRLSVTQRRQR
jgi:exopolyphosphatase/guanosine-5'-triphosphate,3'-diphosphate pyrophosphatase